MLNSSQKPKLKSITAIACIFWSNIVSASNPSIAPPNAINIGGVNDSHKFLYPETATNNLEVLEEAFVSYHENEDKKIDAVAYDDDQDGKWDRVEEVS